MSKPLQAGGEVDSWCTKCRRLVAHRIVAMVGPTPVRVECEACRSQHNYKARGPGERGSVSGVSGRRASGSPTPGQGTSSHGTTGRSGPRVTRAEQELRVREEQWEHAIVGKLASEFRPYGVKNTFAAGDIIRHSKFGDGVVTRVLDPTKIEVLFKEGDTRTLAQGAA